MTTTPRLQVSEMTEGQIDKEGTFNEAIRRAEIMGMSGIVQDRTGTPPGSPSDGDAVLVTTGTGDFASQDDGIAFAMSSVWYFIDPYPGMRVFVTDEAREYRYVDSSQGWIASNSLLSLPDISSTTLAGGSGYVLTIADDESSAFFTENPFDVEVGFEGLPGNAEVVKRIIMARPCRFDPDFIGSVGDTEIASTGSVDFSVQVDGVEIGTVNVNSSTFTFNTTASVTQTVDAGEVITVVAPSTADATLADFCFTLKGWYYLAS